MKTYRLSRGWTWFIYIGGSLLSLAFIYVMIMPFVDDTIHPQGAFFFVPLGLGMFAFMLIGIRDAYRGRLEVYNDRFVQYTWLREKELLFSDVEGFRELPQYIFIESAIPEKKRLKISTYYGNLEELLWFLEQEFSNLNAKRFEEEEEKILNDPALGLDVAERTQRLEQARNIAQVLSYAGVGVLLWLFFYPSPYHWAMWAAFALPLIALPFLFIYKGIIRFDEMAGSAHPSISGALIAPSMGLGLRAFLDYDVLSYTKAWLPTGMISLAFVLIMILSLGQIDMERYKEYLKVLGIGLLLVPFGFGATVFYNCYYDNGEPQGYVAEVRSQRISDGSRYTSYYLEIASEEDPSNSQEVSVSEELYFQVSTGDDVGVFEWPGRLGIPWRMLNALPEY